MIIYLYGPDSYRRQEKVKWYLEEFRKKHSGLTIEKFSLLSFAEASEDLAIIKDFVVAQSLFGGAKLGIISGVEEVETKEIAPILKSVLEDKNTTLIISEEKKLPKEYNFLLKAHTVKEFKEPSGSEIAEFIKKESAKRNFRVSPEIINGLIRANGSNLWGVVNDLDKLALGGKLDEAVAMPIFWNLIGKLKKSGAPREGLSALAYLLESEEPAMVFNMVASQADPALKTKMADYDVAIKSGKLEYEEALLELVIG